MKAWKHMVSMSRKIDCQAVSPEPSAPVATDFMHDRQPNSHDSWTLLLQALGRILLDDWDVMIVQANKNS